MNWLLLRGLAREKAHWGEFGERLSRARPGDTVFMQDLPGMGEFYRERSPRSIAEIRRWVQAATAHLPRPLGLIGMSLGGMVAIDWAFSRPADLAGVVLIGTSTALSRPWDRMKPANWFKVIRLLAAGNPAQREREILRLTSNRPLHDALEASWVAIQRQHPVSRANVMRQLYAAARFQSPLSAPDVPGLLLVSTADRLVDYRCTQRLALAWDWPQALHPDAGHDLVLDDPDWVVDQICASLKPLHNPPRWPI